MYTITTIDQKQQTSGRIWKYTFEDLLRNCWKVFLTLSEDDDNDDNINNNKNNKYFPFTYQLNSIAVDYKESRSQGITSIKSEEKSEGKKEKKENIQPNLIRGEI